jgi:hypothetical protein
MLFVALIYIVFSSPLDWNLESFSATLEFFLGGLVSAHLLASDSSKKLIQGSYKNQLLGLAEDLGIRFLPAFNTPYAWINLKVLYKTLKRLKSCSFYLYVDASYFHLIAAECLFNSKK